MYAILTRPMKSGRISTFAESSLESVFSPGVSAALPSCAVFSELAVDGSLVLVVSVVVLVAVVVAAVCVGVFVSGPFEQPKSNTEIATISNGRATGFKCRAENMNRTAQSTTELKTT